MRIHTYEKLWLVAALVLIVGIIATITYGAVGLGIAMIDDSEETIDAANLGDDERFSDPGIEQVGEDEYEVTVVARQFNYDPGTDQLRGFDPIEVPTDSEVTFYVTSGDVLHSFSVVDTNLNTMVVPGEVSTMTAVFDEPGEYGILCNEYCGPEHHEMEGRLVVHDADEFDLFEIEAVDGPEAVDPGDEATFTVTVANDRLEERSTTVVFEFDDETFEEDVTVDADGTADVTFTVDTDGLEVDDYGWTATVDDGMERTVEESDQLAVGEEEDEEEE